MQNEAVDAASTLKPRGVMELFDQAIRIYRGNFFQFVGIIAVAEVPLQVLQLILYALFFLVASNSGNSSYLDGLSLVQPASIVIALITSMLTYVFVSGLATAALTRAITARYLGEAVTIAGVYQNIWGVWGSLFLALLLAFLFFLAILVWAIIPCVGWVTGFGMIFFASMVVFPLIAPIIVIERASSNQAIRRAWELARKRFWWLTGFFLLLNLFNFLVVQGPVQLVATAIQVYFLRGAEAANLASMTTLQAVSTSVLTLIISLLYIPLASTCAVLAYFDLRMRQEGFDLALMARAANDAQSSLEIASQAPSAPKTSLVTWNEMGKFALISLIPVGIYAIIYAILFAFIMLFALSMDGIF